MVDPFAACTAADRVAAWQQIAREGAVVRRVLPNGLPAWLVTRQAECREVLNSGRYTKSMGPTSVLIRRLRPHLMPVLGSHMLMVDGPDHVRLRRLVNAAFTRRPMEALDGRIRVVARELLDGLAVHDPDEVVDLLEHFAFPLPMTVICELLGVPEEHRAEFRELSATFLAGVYAPEAELAVALDRIVELLGELVAAKREQPAADLISALVAARDGADRLTENELISMINLLTIAGHETTVNLLASGAAALLAQPEQRARLGTDPASVEVVVEELLRYCSPVQVTFPLIAAGDTTLAGVAITAGDIVVPVLLTANRDPERAAQPDMLDVGRSPNQHLAFGHGAHHCLGAPLARLEARVALPALLDRFPDLQLATSYDSLAWRPNFLINGLAALPVRLGEPTDG
jgi:cytochrome P450